MTQAAFNDPEPERKPSEVAQMIAALAPALPRETLLDLRELVAHHIAVPSAPRRREAQLGLLMELLDAKTGEYPDIRAYKALHKQRAAEGEEWPSASKLSRDYGLWVKAVQAAARLRFEGSHKRVPSNYTHARDHAPYSRDEVVWALERFRHDHGDWPTKWEFEDWRPLARMIARHAGAPMPRIPSMKTIRRLFGTFERAVEVAKRHSS